MGLRTQTNVEASNAHRQLTSTSMKAAKAMEKLSSGNRINRAADDAAGLAISAKMRSQIGGLAQAQRNAQDGISLMQTAEGSLNEVHSMLQRVRDLKVQHSNGTLDASDKEAIVNEAGELAKEIYVIADETEFNGKKLFGDDPFTFQVGANDGEQISTKAVDLKGNAAVASAGASWQESLGNNSVRDLGHRPSAPGDTYRPGSYIAGGDWDKGYVAARAAVAAKGVGEVLAVAYKTDATTGKATSTETTAAEANAAFRALTLAQIDGAIEFVSTARSEFGAAQNRMQHRLANLATYQENLVGSESRIRDVDLAAEMVNFTKLNVLNQAGTSMLSQANQGPRGFLSLLR